MGDLKKALVKGVELRGLEPLTPTLPVWCATSCATAPCDPVWCVRAVGNCTGLTAHPRAGGTAPHGAAPSPGSDRSDGHLRDAQVVAERVPEPEVDAVRLVDRLLGDL